MDKVQHFEIPADDTKRARGFYEKVFGWKTMDFPMPSGEYIGLHTGPVDKKNMWKEKGFINGGMFKRGSEFPVKGPTVAVVVADIDESLKKVRALGGKIVMDKKNMGGMGLYAYVEDTENNVIGIWQDLSQKKPKTKKAKK